MSDWWHWLLAIALCAAAIVLAFRSARNAPPPAGEEHATGASQAVDSVSESPVDEEAQARRVRSEP